LLLRLLDCVSVTLLFVFFVTHRLAAEATPLHILLELKTEGRQILKEWGVILPRATSADGAFIQPAMASVLGIGLIPLNFVTIGNGNVTSGGMYKTWTPSLLSGGGCSPLPSTTPDLSNKIVILPSASGCAFVQKIQNAAAHGANYVLTDFNVNVNKRASSYDLLLDLLRMIGPNADLVLVTPLIRANPHLELFG
jgi:hypothetical protein